MGTSVANWRGFRHHQQSGGALLAQDERPLYHLGSASIDTQRPTAIGRQAILDLHDAAVQSAQAFEAEASATLGTWWDDLCADADAAQVAVADHPKTIALIYYRGPVDLT